MGSPLKTPPVYFTILQVRYNPILKLTEFLPAIQDAMRRSGFPDFKMQKIFTLQISNEAGQPKPVPTITDKYLFGDIDKKHNFTLDASSLTLQSTAYGHFESFSTMFLAGLATVHDAVQLDFTERIGLRYFDRVIPRSGDTIDKYLLPEVRGMSNHLGGKTHHSYTETVCEIDGVRLVSRVAIQEGGLSFPPDVNPEDMKVDKRFTDYIGLSAILDNDGIVEKREPFSLETVKAHVSKTHDVIGAAFRATATTYAQQVWKEGL